MAHLVQCVNVFFLFCFAFLLFFFFLRTGNPEGFAAPDCWFEKAARAGTLVACLFLDEDLKKKERKRAALVQMKKNEHSECEETERLGGERARVANKRRGNKERKEGGAHGRADWLLRSPAQAKYMVCWVS